MAGSELVDYDRVADLYQQGRAMPDEVLDRWGRAVRPHLPAGGRVRVADVGAGTGIFAAVWPAWGASDVVAVEVSAAMATHGRRRGALRVGRVAWFSRWVAPAGFTVRHVEDLRDVETTYGEAADWVERMRHADSMLTALTDDEDATGVRRLRATPDEPAVLDLSLVVLDR